MSNILMALRRLLRALNATDCPPSYSDTLPLREWADLPAHHPVSDRAPC